MLSDEWLPRYRLLENFNIKWNGKGNGNGNAHGNGNAYDRGDYNSSFALHAGELKTQNNKDHQKEYLAKHRGKQKNTKTVQPKNYKSSKQKARAMKKNKQTKNS